MPIKSVRPADWGDSPSEIQNASGNPLYHKVELNWRDPTPWEKGQSRPLFDPSEQFVYALLHDHGKATTKDRIVYIGLTSNPRHRFGNHETALDIVSRRGRVQFTYAPITFIRGRDRLRRVKQALEEIEHLLIWAVPDHLENEKKWFTLPGMGVNAGDAWHILNRGYRFHGQMPREIIYPWMLIKLGRDRSAR
jgi:hypothetical protein